MFGRQAWVWEATRKTERVYGNGFICVEQGGCVGQAMREIEIVYGSGFMCLAGKPGCGTGGERNRNGIWQRLHVFGRQAWVWEATRKIERVHSNGFMC